MRIRGPCSSPGSCGGIQLTRAARPELRATRGGPDARATASLRPAAFPAMHEILWRGARVIGPPGRRTLHASAQASRLVPQRRSIPFATVRSLRSAPHARWHTGRVAARSRQRHGHRGGRGTTQFGLALCSRLLVMVPLSGTC